MYPFTTCSVRQLLLLRYKLHGRWFLSHFWLQLFLSSYSPVGDPAQIEETKRYLKHMLMGLAADYYAWDPSNREVCNTYQLVMVSQYTVYLLSRWRKACG